MNVEDEKTILEQAEPITADEQESVSTEGDAIAPEDENEVTVTIGEEKPVEDEVKDPALVRHLRKVIREKTTRERELEAKLNAQNTVTKPVLGPEPDLGDDGIDYDPERYKSAYKAWSEKKAKADVEEEQRRSKSRADEDAWEAEQAEHQKRKDALKKKVKNYDESEAEALGIINETQHNIIIHVAKNSAAMLVALGDNPVEAKKLAAITDYSKFIYALAELETKVKITPKKPTTQPERTISSTGHISGTVDSTLDRLMEDAAKTGDRSKVLAYKSQKRKTN